MKKGAWIDFSLWLAATELVGILSGCLAGDIRAVYQNLHQPPFSPPGWVFPVMWGILYAMMAISAYLIQHADSTPWKKRRTALILYAVPSTSRGALSFFGFKSSVLPLVSSVY